MSPPRSRMVACPKDELYSSSGGLHITMQISRHFTANFLEFSLTIYTNSSGPKLNAVLDN